MDVFQSSQKYRMLALFCLWFMFYVICSLERQFSSFGLIIPPMTCNPEASFHNTFIEVGGKLHWFLPPHRHRHQTWQQHRQKVGFKNNFDELILQLDQGSRGVFSISDRLLKVLWESTKSWTLWPQKRAILSSAKPFNSCLIDRIMRTFAASFYFCHVLLTFKFGILMFGFTKTM